MKKNLTNLKNIFLTLALLLTISTNAFAEIFYTFTYDGEVLLITEYPNGGLMSDNSITLTVPNANWTCYVRATATNHWGGGTDCFNYFVKRGPGKLVQLDYPGFTYSKISRATISGGSYEVNSNYLLFSADITVFSGATLRIINPGENKIFGYNINTTEEEHYGKGTVEFSSGSSFYNYFFTGNINVANVKVLNGRLVMSDHWISCPVEVSSGAFLGFACSSDFTCNTVITGAGGITKANGGGNFTLSSACTYTGDTQIRGNGAFILTGSIENSRSVELLDEDSEFVISSPKKIKGLNGSKAGAKVKLDGLAAILTIGNGNNADYQGSYFGKITGAGALVKDGPGSLTLYGNNNDYTGVTEFFEGRLIFGANSLGTGAIKFFGDKSCTLYWNDGNTKDISGRIVLHSGSTNKPITFDVSKNDVSFASPLPATLTGKITKAGSGKLAFGAPQTFTSPIEVSEGTLVVMKWTNMGINGSIDNITSLTVNSGATFEYYTTVDVTFAKAITGKGNFTKSGIGTLTLSGENTYEGATNITGGTLSTKSWLGVNFLTVSSLSSKTSGVEISSGATFEHTEPLVFTFSKPISGEGNFVKKGNGILKLTGNNTYSGETTVSAGTLQLGNGTTNGNLVNTSKVTIGANTALRFEPASTITFSKVITGDGDVEIKGKGTANDKAVYFTANNTYTGNTTIEQGILWFGNNSSSTAGSVSGNIVVNLGAYVGFGRGNDWTYSKVISGNGGVRVYQHNNSKITLSGANTYFGRTDINAGGLSLSGSIANSSIVQLFNDGKFYISGGDKTINKLTSTSATSEVILGSKTLTLSEGSFEGKFIGEGGGVTKTGLDYFSMLGNNIATGTFNFEQGRVNLSGTWNGDFTQKADTYLDIIEVAEIKGNLKLLGGEISMNLFNEPPSKIFVNGQVQAVGKTKLSISCDDVEEVVIMQASTGINVNDYTLNMYGFDAFLSANGTQQLLLTATMLDHEAPQPGYGLENGEVDFGTASFSWGSAYDDATPQELLRYFVYQSYNEMTSVEDCENGILLNPGGTLNLTKFTVTGLEPDTYWFNVVVMDQSGKRACYYPLELTVPNGIASATLSNQIHVYPNPTTGKLTIDNGQLTIKSVELYDVVGKKLFEEKENLTVLRSYDLTVFPNGVYFLKITTENGIVTKKVIKK